MINVGCKFGPNDLTPEEWNELIALAQERAWIQDKLMSKDKPVADAELTTEERSKREKVRVDSGLPPAGGSIFPQNQRKMPRR